jgi:hypothetical protein
LIELSERLSEFSYGYGVTRAVEKCLESIGIKTSPFLPSLIHEKEVGFDVQFKKSIDYRKPGAVLLLQFKLGQSLERFKRTDLRQPSPNLTKPFWRFKIDTAEPDGQYEMLLKAETDGSEVYYAAPKFSDWTEYAEAFESDAVLEKSLLVSPNDIRQQLVAKGISDDKHRIVYDETHVYVCSQPVPIPKRDRDTLVQNIGTKIFDSGQPLFEAISRIYDGLGDRASIRRTTESPDYQRELIQAAPAFPQRGASRSTRLENLLSRARTPEDAKAVALGFETWSLGAQLVLATEA